MLNDNDTFAVFKRSPTCGSVLVIAFVIWLHSCPIDAGLNALSRNTYCARAKYMSFAELWPETGWKLRSASAPCCAIVQYGVIVAASAYAKCRGSEHMPAPVAYLSIA